MIVNTGGEIFLPFYSISASDQLSKSPQKATNKTHVLLNKSDQD